MQAARRSFLTANEAKDTSSDTSVVHRDQNLKFQLDDFKRYNQNFVPHHPKMGRA